MTKGDEIRAKNNHELAVYLHGMIECEKCPAFPSCFEYSKLETIDDECIQAIEDYLESGEI